MPLNPPSGTEIFHQQASFDALKSRMWNYQIATNSSMKLYLEALEMSDQQFIPISFFKQTDMRAGSNWKAELVFKSSGTGGDRSIHQLKDKSIYDSSIEMGFEYFFGNEKLKILALLPGYLEQGDSSLIYMVEHLIEIYGMSGSGFFLHSGEKLQEELSKSKVENDKVLLIGVSYALLDFAESSKMNLWENCRVMETGGMKGRRKEMTRKELHASLEEGFGISNIYSEYGMTELLSQAYSKRDGIFECPPWMKVVITDPLLPGRELPVGTAGRICVIDLANVHSCSFIATDDIGRIVEGGFEVLGRLDHAELRGCNLMIQS